MKKTALMAITLSLVSSTLLAKGLTNKEVENIPFFKNNKLEVIQISPVSQMYEVIGVTSDAAGNVNAAKFVMSKDKSSIIVGSNVTVLDAKTGQPSKANVDVKSMLKHEAYTFGNGKEEVILFTDPECPYCKKIEAAMEGMKNDVTFHVFFFPLQMHKNASMMADYVLSKPKAERHAALLETAKNDFLSKGYKNSLKNTDVLKKHMGYGAALNVQGTPSLFDMKGKPIDLQFFMTKHVKPEVKTHVDTEGLKFLIENKSTIVVNEMSDKPNLFIFAETNSHDSQKLLSKESLEKLTQKYTVNIQLVPSQANEESFAEAVYVMLGKDHEEVMSRLQKMMTGGNLEKEDRDQLDKLVADKDKNLSEIVMKIGSMPQIMSQMGVASIPIVTDEAGKILKPEQI